ncbi:hypothetical protein B0H14DRAFT_2561537 [Mycena olivaceomarginata]|nr:hypothetical protein B0H14DRAFT_2561537 [Mycena olivaceomarginata]
MAPFHPESTLGLGAIELGIFATLLLFGMLVPQVYLYYLCNSDRTRVKLLVAAVFILEACHTGSAAQALYCWSAAPTDLLAYFSLQSRLGWLITAILSVGASVDVLSLCRLPLLSECFVQDFATSKPSFVLVYSLVSMTVAICPRIFPFVLSYTFIDVWFGIFAVLGKPSVFELASGLPEQPFIAPQARLTDAPFVRALLRRLHGRHLWGCRVCAELDGTNTHRLRARTVQPPFVSSTANPTRGLGSTDPL